MWTFFSLTKPRHVNSLIISISDRRVFFDALCCGLDRYGFFWADIETDYL